MSSLGWGSQWETLANAITSYYGGGIDSAQYKQVVKMLNSGNYTMEEMDAIIGQIPEFNRTYNANGELINVSYKATATGNTAAGSIANQINSNAANATQTQFQTVQTITKDAQTGKVTMSDTVTKYNAGTAGTTKAVVGSAVSAIGATAVGISVGKTVDSLLYNANPNFWNEHGMSALNPETWNSITAGDSSLGSTLFNFIFGIDPDNGNPQPYMDENAFAYMVAYMTEKGVFNPAESQLITPEFPASMPPDIVLPLPVSNGESILKYTQYGSNRYFKCAVTNGAVFTAMLMKNSNNAYYNPYIFIASETPAQYGFVANTTNPDAPITSYYDLTRITRHNKSFYYSELTTGINLPITSFEPLTNYSTQDSFFNSSTYGQEIGYEILYAASGGGGGVDGINSQEGVTQFDASGITDPSDIAAVLLALQTQFPDLWDNRIEVSPDGDTTHVYIPVGFPTGGTGTQPTTNGATATDLAPDIADTGDNVTDELIKTLIDMIQNPQTQNGMESDTTTPTQPIDPNMPDGGAGETPAVVLPSGSGSALYSIYNPTQAQIDSFGAWLWSSNFVDQLKKIFNDPMQAIIGLHKIFATPPTSGTGNITVGYLDSGVNSKLVNEQYTEVDCGTVQLDEYFKNALDYLNTDVYLYLPFVGIVPLNVEDVTRASISVKYKVDVLTGACLATVNVTRDAGGGGQLYVYSGNCSVTYPISSGSYMGIIAGGLGIAGSIASTIISGGAMLPMALTAGAGAMSRMKTNIEHSGSLSGNAGAMGIKKPYLIIRRPQTKIATNYPHLAGGSDNTFGVLSSFTGHVRVKYIHIENIPATGEELNEIETLLKSGVMI